MSYDDDYTVLPPTHLPQDTPNTDGLTWEMLRDIWSPRRHIRVDRDGDNAVYVDVPAGHTRPPRPHALYLADEHL